MDVAVSCVCLFVHNVRGILLMQQWVGLVVSLQVEHSRARSGALVQKLSVGG